ncbi:uncharacterized protein LOC126989740 [Eriocheir sinensis]|uniref:uncharacterized protein LOC126989740 n=1 Tax=Eriocheir sinensis TaxID=95602 RepID=UPI0021C9608C|nr:uncharacterized protein LOC126989740 [Eriocheir sinensis]
MISQFPYDYMHLVCLGVTRKLLGLWIKEPVQNRCRVGRNVINSISEDLLKYWKFLPFEFTRKYRSLAEMDRWKATEFRQFLLYSGPVVLKNKLPADKYENFLDISVAIYCLSIPFYSTTHCQYAHELLCTFVKDFGKIYSEEMLVYNVHGLSHLADDVAHFGPLDNFSAFPFENFLGKFKSMIRKPNSPIQQIIRRLNETQNFQPVTVKKTDTDKQNGIPKYTHEDGPLPEIIGDFFQFKKFTYRNMKFTATCGDNCVKVGSNVGLIRNILTRKPCNETLVLFEAFNSVTSFFQNPLSSSDLDIYKVSKLSGNFDIAPISEILTKYVMLPYKKNKFVIIPLIHQYNTP